MSENGISPKHEPPSEREKVLFLTKLVNFQKLCLYRKLYSKHPVIIINLHLLKTEKTSIFIEKR